MLKDFKDVKDLVMDQECTDDFAKIVFYMNNTFKRCGLQPKGLTFKASQHTLIDERHVYGDGQPFYAFTVEAEGSEKIPDMISASATPTQQAMWIAREVGMNLMPNMAKRCDVGSDEVYEGSEGENPFGPNPKYEAYTRWEPKDYGFLLSLQLSKRLQKLLPQVQTAPAKKQGGPAI